MGEQRRRRASHGWRGHEPTAQGQWFTRLRCGLRRKGLTSPDWTSRDCNRDVGIPALAKHDLETASRVYRHVGDVGMVWTLDEFRSVEDKRLIGGHVFMMMGDYDAAQNMYLQSGTPVEALHMRRDLLHWDQVGIEP